MLNDPSYVEASRVFAARIVKEGGQDPDARLAWAFRQALQRLPSAEEVEVLRELARKQAMFFAANPKSAEALLKVGYSPLPADVSPVELAAWTSVARVLFNLHEVITRN